ncbi:hypothetical protein Tsubulata_010293 [Turnera subulata]|uniref:C2H2-type domain-containing protein n=1 Tax=Turnera subulata TaxID=218843 RepID=A0A9Q0J6S4_9ROSI|nr:hypothetical protein Tsubulata_010293 [Turnera subulata]
MMSGDAFSIPSPLPPSFAAQEQNLSNPNPKPNPNPVAKKKRNLPGTPDPDAEVIALSPKTLMATNRFICEICNKGFQRDQNLQLHRRGHNLPWKLRQRTNKEVRKKVYICPEKTCVHHDPSRALGDLTGIKKHFSRKHGEKKWKCEKCSKKYAVQSDWKAHSKTCGTREYKCDCGTLFSRKDSFITHRAFCDALAEESARISSAATNLNFRNDPVNSNHGFPGLGVVQDVQMNIPHHHQFGQPGFRPDLINGMSTTPNSSLGADHHHHHKPGLPLWLNQANSHVNPGDHFLAAAAAANSNLYGSSTSTGLPEMIQMGSAAANFYGSSSSTSNLGNLTLSGLHPRGLKEEGGNKGNSMVGVASSPLFSSDTHQNKQSPKPGLTPMSATALLQKAAQMGSTRSSNQSFFGNSYGLMTSCTTSSTTTNFNILNQNQNSNNNELHQVFENVKQQASTTNSTLPPAATSGVAMGDGMVGSSASNNFDQLVMQNSSGKKSDQSARLKLQRGATSSVDQNGLTRDFLGMSSDSGRPFSPQDLAKFASLSSAMGLSQYTANH